MLTRSHMLSSHAMHGIVHGSAFDDQTAFMCFKHRAMCHIHIAMRSYSWTELHPLLEA